MLELRRHCPSLKCFLCLELYVLFILFIKIIVCTMFVSLHLLDGWVVFLIKHDTADGVVVDLSVPKVLQGVR